MTSNFDPVTDLEIADMAQSEFYFCFVNNNVISMETDTLRL